MTPENPFQQSQIMRSFGKTIESECAARKLKCRTWWTDDRFIVKMSRGLEEKRLNLDTEELESGLLDVLPSFLRRVESMADDFDRVGYIRFVPRKPEGRRRPRWAYALGRAA
jgi:hypothetical protein